MNDATSAATNPFVDPVDFVATDVTGLRRLEFEDVDGHRSAGDVALSVASAMDLPVNVPWALRHEQKARMLDQEATLGSQIDTGSELVVIPRSHLG